MASVAVHTPMTPNLVDLTMSAARLALYSRWCLHHARAVGEQSWKK